MAISRSHSYYVFSPSKNDISGGDDGVNPDYSGTAGSRVEIADWVIIGRFFCCPQVEARERCAPRVAAHVGIRLTRHNITPNVPASATEDKAEEIA
jgi:hypothetical protein